MKDVGLIYCVQRLDDGAWVARDREYRAIKTDFLWKVPPSFPVVVTWDKKETVYLYNDVTIPTASAANWVLYINKLASLSPQLIA